MSWARDEDRRALPRPHQIGGKDRNDLPGEFAGFFALLESILVQDLALRRRLVSSSFRILSCWAAAPSVATGDWASLILSFLGSRAFSRKGAN